MTETQPTQEITGIRVSVGNRATHLEGNRGGSFVVHIPLPRFDDPDSRYLERDQGRGVLGGAFTHMYPSQAEAVETAGKILTLVNAHAEAVRELETELAAKLKNLWPAADKETI
jgi:hypothetical protein